MKTSPGAQEPKSPGGTGFFRGDEGVWSLVGSWPHGLVGSSVRGLVGSWARGFILSSLLLGFTSALWSAKPLPLDQAVQKITAIGAYSTVEELSSAKYDGRLTGTPGYEAAAKFAASELKKAGLRPAPGLPDYLQAFPVTLGGIESAEMELLPVEDKSGEPQKLTYFKEYMPLLQSASGDVTAEVVFAGFGITAPELGRDDYAGLDAKGRIVVVVRGEPKDGKDWSAHNDSKVRAQNAKDHGASAFLLADQAVASPNGVQIPSLPMAEISTDFANTLLEGKKLKVEDLKKVLEQGGLCSFPTGRKLHFTVKAKEARDATGYNVLAVLPGSDPALTAEYVVVGGHLDHCGSWPSLLPGADDNASGSATVLEVARAAASLSPRPKRTLLFAFFGGEEMGLLGSKFLAGNPPKGLGRCVGVLNLDMTGVGYGAYVSGGQNFPEIMKALEAARDRIQPGMPLRAGLSSGEPRADHGPFQKAGIHAVSLFGMGGSHHGYHTPEDTLFFVTPKSMEALGRVVLEAAVTLADEK